MFPFRDHNPSARTPYVTIALMALNIAIFLWGWVTLDSERAYLAFYDRYAMIPIYVTHGQNVSSLLTSLFLHAGWMHLLGNMLFLWIFGDNLEDEMGPLPFLGFYLASGIAASLLQIATDPDSTVPTVGASGAIAGVMGGYLLLFPKARVDILLFLVVYYRIFAVPAWLMLGIWFGLQFFDGLRVDTSHGGVAYWAHVGGFVAGLALSVPLFLRLGGRRFWARTDGHPPHPPAPSGRSAVPLVRRRR